MIEKQTKVVWILGAGFSKALGGPLLGDLLRPYSDETLRQLHDDFFHHGPAGEEEKNRRDGIIRGMCNLRFAFVEASQKPGCLWRDAEQFLDLAETAAAESPEQLPTAGRTLSHAQPVLKEFVRDYDLASDPVEIALAARRAIADDCSLFLRKANVASEKWTPYREWAQGLGANHMVVTFNYDLVPDLLAEHDGKLLVPIPSELADSKSRSVVEDKALVYKVHGSVNWYRTPNGAIDRQKEDRGHAVDLSGNACLLNKALEDFAIGVPGPQKGNLIGGALKPLWDEAMSCIRQAGLIIFVGYRFPPVRRASQAGDPSRDPQWHPSGCYRSWTIQPRCRQNGCALKRGAERRDLRSGGPTALRRGLSFALPAPQPGLGPTKRWPAYLRPPNRLSPGRLAPPWPPKHESPGQGLPFSATKARSPQSPPPLPHSEVRRPGSLTPLAVL
jgi:hypothetical protein